MRTFHESGTKIIKIHNKKLNIHILHHIFYHYFSLHCFPIIFLIFSPLINIHITKDPYINNENLPPSGSIDLPRSASACRGRGVVPHRWLQQSQVVLGVPQLFNRRLPLRVLRLAERPRQRSRCPLAQRRPRLLLPHRYLSPHPGMLMENGPFVFVTNTTTIKLNDFAWNKKANVLYLESPGGVGFSKSFRNNNFTYTDPTTTEDNYKALTDFFRKFPNLKKNDFYISGESYAGIYVPYLANEILEKNKLPNTEVKINLKGILVGNACTDPR